MSPRIDATGIFKMKNKEIWKDVISYEGLYRVSSIGRVQSVERFCKHVSGTRRVPAKTMQLRKMKCGYMSVQLCKNAVSVYKLVHRLVLESFVGPCPKGMESRHFPDGCRTNNKLSNLGWTTPKKNAMDRVIHNTVNWGERNGHAKLSIKQVNLIKREVAKGKSYAELGRQLNVHRCTVRDVAIGRCWKHVCASK